MRPACARGPPWREAPAEAAARLAALPAHLAGALLPLHAEGVRFGLARRGRLLLADEMGVGKTVQAIALLACYQVRGALRATAPVAATRTFRRLRCESGAAALVAPADPAPDGGGERGAGERDADRAAACVSALACVCVQAKPPRNAPSLFRSRVPHPVLLPVNFKALPRMALRRGRQDEWPALVVTPASLRLAWAEELARWLPHLRPAHVHVVEGRADRLAAGHASRVVITSYDMLARLSCAACRGGGRGRGACAGGEVRHGAALPQEPSVPVGRLSSWSHKYSRGSAIQSFRECTCKALFKRHCLPRRPARLLPYATMHARFRL